MIGSNILLKAQKLRKKPNIPQMISFGEIAYIRVNMLDAKNNLTAEEYSYIKYLFGLAEQCRRQFPMDMDKFVMASAFVIEIFDLFAPYYKFSGDPQSMFCREQNKLENKKEQYRIKAKELLKKYGKDFDPFIELVFPREYYSEWEELFMEFYAGFYATFLEKNYKPLNDDVKPNQNDQQVINEQKEEKQKIINIKDKETKMREIAQQCGLLQFSQPNWRTDAPDKRFEKEMKMAIPLLEDMEQSGRYWRTEMMLAINYHNLENYKMAVYWLQKAIGTDLKTPDMGFDSAIALTRGTGPWREKIGINDAKKVDAVGYGYEKDNAADVNGGYGEYFYMNSLCPKNGELVYWRRMGSCLPDQEGHIIDCYHCYVVDDTEEHNLLEYTIYLDMYNTNMKQIAPEGFDLDLSFSKIQSGIN